MYPCVGQLLWSRVRYQLKPHAQNSQSLMSKAQRHQGWDFWDSIMVPSSWCSPWHYVQVPRRRKGKRKGQIGVAIGYNGQIIYQSVNPNNRDYYGQDWQPQRLQGGRGYSVFLGQPILLLAVGHPSSADAKSVDTPLASYLVLSWFSPASFAFRSQFNNSVWTIIMSRPR